MELYLRLGRRRIVALTAILLAIELFDEIVDGASQAAWPLVRSDLDLTYTQIGLLFAVPTLFAHAIEPLLGLLGDVWRRHTIIALGGVAYATALVAFAAAGGFEPLLIAMMLLYPASGAFVSLSQATLIDMNPGREEKAMVGWTVAGSLGVAAGPIALAGMLALGLQWRELYVGLALLSLTLALLFAWVSPPRSPAATHGTTLGEALRQAWDAVRNRRVVRWLVLLAAVDLVLETMVGFLALYLVDEAGATPRTAALALTVWTVAALAGEALLLAVINRVRGLTVIRVTALIAMVLIATFLGVDGLVAKVALLGCIAFASAGWYSILVARYYAELNGQTGVAMAVSSVVGPLQAMVPAAMGWVAESVGLGNAMWLVLLGPAVLIVGLRRADQGTMSI